MDQENHESEKPMTEEEMLRNADLKSLLKENEQMKSELNGLRVKMIESEDEVNLLKLQCSNLERSLKE